MNQDEALAFLNPQESPLEAPVQGESMSPDEAGTQLVEQPIARGMSREDALNFLTAKTEETTPRGSDASYLNAPIPSAQNPSGMSRDDALAFLTSTAPSEQTAAPINLPAIPQEAPPIPEISQAKPMGFMEQAGRFMSPLLGPTEAQRFEESVPVDENLTEQQNVANALQGVVPPNATYQYKPYANRLEREQGIFTPFVETPQLQPSPADTTAEAVGKGVFNVGAGLAGMFMSPGGVLLGGAPKELEAASEGIKQIGRGAAGLFSGQMISGIPEQVRQAMNPKALLQERVQGGLGAVVSGVFGGLSARHAIMGEKRPIIPETKLNPSADPAVNQKESLITANADAQAPLPEAPAPINIPAKEAPAAKTKEQQIDELFSKQFDYLEGSPEHTKIQAEIDALNKPAEAPAVSKATPAKAKPSNLPATGGELTANLVESGTSLESFGQESLKQLAEHYGIDIPEGASRGEIIDAINSRKPAEAPVAEAQPPKPNAIQIASATQAMLRPQVTGQGEVVELPRVGEQNAEVPAKEVEAPKEVALTEEQQAEKVLLDKIDAEAGSPKPVKPKAPKPNPYTDILSRYESGEENAITTPSDLVNEVEKIAKRQRNQYLKDAVDRYKEDVGSGQVDVELEIEKLLNEVKREENAYEEKKSPLKKTAKTKEKPFGSGDAIIEYLQANKIQSKSYWQKSVRRKGGTPGEGEYGSMPKLPKKHAESIYGKHGIGQTPHDAIKGLHENGEAFNIENPDQLWEYIKSQSDTTKRAGSEEKQQDAELKKLEDSQKQIEAAKDNPDKLAAIEAEVLREHFESLRRRSRGEGGFIEFPDFIKDAAIRVGDSVRKKVTSFKDWSNGMIERLGEGVRGFLKDIWASVRDNWNKDIGGGFDTGGRSLEKAAEEAKFAPKSLTDKETFAKRIYDSSVKQRGRPPTQEEMASILSNHFANITPSEITAAYDLASGKPKPPAAYAGVAATAGETPEQISIRRKDQADQVRRGILTSEIPAGEGITKDEVIERGKRNLANGDDPFDAVERARNGDQNALNTARAYADALGRATSEALRKHGPQSKEYKELAAKNQSYREKLAEAGTYASNLLRSFQGETDLSDAADIAREYTKITGQEPTLSQHEQIRKISEKVNSTIKESDAATEAHSTAMDEGLAGVDVSIPETVEGGRQQVADLSDVVGTKAKAEIERLNKELEETKKSLEEVKQAQATGQDAASLREYYQAKIDDLNKQLESTPKYGKEVFEQAQKIVDRWKADRLEAEKLLSKQLLQMGSFPDVSIVATLARIMRGHIGELALDFAKSSKMLIEKFGPKIEPYLKDAWAKAQELVKGEAGGEKAVKSVRKAKAKEKPEAKMTPAEKTADNLRKRIAQYEKKINDINEGKVSTPKDVEKVTNDEIKGLEADLAQKKKDIADARLKAKQRELFEKGKVGDDLNPEQVKTLWESAKRFYLDKGESDYDKMIADLASDFGLTPDQIRKGFASPKGAKKASDEMYDKQRNRQMALDEAKRWLVKEQASWIGTVFGTAAEKTFKLAIFGHGTAFIGTHAPTVLYTHPTLALKAWLKGFSYSFRGKDGRIKNIVDNKDLIYRQNWISARRGGLENDPRETRREGATPARSDSKLARALDTISGGRGFDALFHLRQDMFDQAWNQLSVTQRSPEMAKMLAERINNATGFTKGGKGSAGILQSPITKVLFFAPKLIASRFKWLIQDPAQMLSTFAKMANPFMRVTEAEKMNAIYEVKNKAKFLGVLAGTLAANQALLSLSGSDQKINYTDPKKNDWLAYKGFGYQFATIGAMTRIARLIAQEYHAVNGELTRWEKAKGGREAVAQEAVIKYLKSGFSPIARDIIVGATGKDYVGNVVPWSKEQPDRGRRRLTYGQLLLEQFTPIPISEAATQKEAIPAVAKAAAAAFTGGRLETPLDLEEYEKSLQAKPRGKSKPLGSIGGSRSGGGLGDIK